MTRLLIFAVIVFTLPTATAAESVSGKERPNLVVFMSDDHGYRDSSVMGAEEFHTPNLERLARDGMTFSHAFVASPTCAPSRAAFLTGLMPIRNGSMRNHDPPSDDCKKLPAYLQELGYEVVAFGKVAHYKQAKMYGFDHFSHDTFHDDECVAAAVEFLKERASDKPLCLLVGTNWPHVPWPETPELKDFRAFRPPPTHVDTPKTRRWRARYAAAVERADHDLGAVYDAAFERLGPNTCFIHFSDHGGQWPFGKWNLYDAGTRVPFFVVWPEVVPAGSKSDAMVSVIDALPTLIQLGGGTPPDDIDGRSFADVLAGERSEHRDCIFTTHSGDGNINLFPIRSVRTPEWKYIRNLRPNVEHSTHINVGKQVDGLAYWTSWVKRAKVDPAAAAIVDRYHHRPAEELYNLNDDPYELHNLAADPEHAQTLQLLREKVDAWMQQQHDRGAATELELEEKAKPRR